MAKLLLQTMYLCALVVTVHGGVFTPEQKQLLEDYINEHLKVLQGKVPAMTVAVVKGNETWVGAFGVADIETGRAVTTSTLFGIGSVTKAFTVQILAQLMDESNGKRLRYLPAVSEFRDDWDYNNWMYILAGRVAEVMGGASWEDLLLTRLLQPLNMTGTKVIGHNGVEVDDGNFARPYLWAEGKLTASAPSIYRISPTEAAGAMASSAEDMAKWLQMLLKNGTTKEGRRVVNAKRMEEIFDSHTSISRHSIGNKFSSGGECPVFVTHGYGFGWFRGAYQGCEIHWHTGSLHGFTSLATHMPSSDGGLAFFASSNGPGPGVAYAALFKVFEKIVSILNTPVSAQVLSDQARWKLASSGFGSTERKPSKLNKTSAFNTSEGPFSTASFYAASAPVHTSKHGYPAASDMGDSPDRPVLGEFITIPKHFTQHEGREVISNFDGARYTGKYRHKLFGDLVIGHDVTGRLTMTFNQLTGYLLKTDVVDVLLFEAVGAYRHISKYSMSGPTVYMEVHFSKLRHGRSYKKLGITAPDLGEVHALNFVRPSSDSDSIEVDDGINDE